MLWRTASRDDLDGRHPGAATALALAVALAWRGSPGRRFAAYQLAGSVTVLILTLLAFAADQASITDLALTLVLLNLPGTMLFAVVPERWI